MSCVDTASHVRICSAKSCGPVPPTSTRFVVDVLQTGPPRLPPATSIERAESANSSARPITPTPTAANAVGTHLNESGLLATLADQLLSRERVVLKLKGHRSRPEAEQVVRHLA